jgi:hypothetical protein
MTDRSIAIRTTFAALSLFAGTAFCTGIASAEEVAPKAIAAARPAAEQTICVRDEVTGSRIKRTVCKTRGEWIARDGVDPSVR